jgi:hypothetical protein
MEPFGVIETASPTAMRDKRRAVAWSMGITMTSSPRFNRASAWPSIVPDTLETTTHHHRQYIANASVYRNLLAFASRSAMYLSALPRGVFRSASGLLFLAEKYPRRSA